MNDKDQDQLEEFFAIIILVICGVLTVLPVILAIIL